MNNWGLQATTPVFVLLTTWALAQGTPSFKTLCNVSIIVLGILIASWVEVDFNPAGVAFQICGIAFEATRLVMVQRLLNSSAEHRMDPLVSLYYFAPVCAAMNFVIFLVFEASSLRLGEIVAKVGVGVLVANATIAFALNVAVVFLVRLSSSPLPPDRARHVLPVRASARPHVCEAKRRRGADRQNVIPSINPLRCPKGYNPRGTQHRNLRHHRHAPAVLWLLCRPGRAGVV